MTTTTMATDWRENRRRDALAKAQVERSRDAARLEGDLARRRLDAELRREAEANSRAQRAQTMRARAERRAAQLAWLREHAIDLVFVPVIVVPGVLAWSAMGSFGYQLFGPVGLLLPAFSEGAMWVFEMRNAWISQHDPGCPTWHLRLGAWVFAAVGAVLNFLHGISVIPGSDRPHGVGIGLVMALVSAAGLAAHQIIKTGPRRTRAERRRARLERAVERREARAQRAAIRAATIDVDADGIARLVFRPGAMMMTRKHGRSSLSVAGTIATTVDPAGDPDTSTQQSAARGETASDSSPGAVGVTTDKDGDEGCAGRSPSSSGSATTATAPEPRSVSKRPTGQRRGRKLTSAEAAYRIADQLAEKPDTSVAELAKLVGRSDRTVRRLRSEGTPELAVSGREGG